MTISCSAARRRRFFSSAVSLRPDAPAAHNNLGVVLKDRGKLDEAVAAHRESIRLLPDYDGPRPDGDDFIPYEGDPKRLDAPRDPRLTTAFRQAMLLNGVDLPGLGGMTMAAHTEEDVERTTAAVAAAVELLSEEGLA